MITTPTMLLSNITHSCIIVVSSMGCWLNYANAIANEQ